MRKINNNILVIVPHQDDEINIAGGVLYSLKNKENVYVCYVTNGDFLIDAKYRYIESINALNKLGIKKDNIIFLGYSDQPYDQKTHIYNQDSDWESLRGYTETYGFKNVKEWNYKKFGRHCKYNKENVINNIEQVINELLPKIIICVDLDFHPDHIMTSLCFEKAMGRILNNGNEYYPEVLKTFAYENSYLGEEDFFTKQNYTKFIIEKNNNIANNPYYSMAQAISVPILKSCYSFNLLINPLWKAIKCHKSQLLCSHTTRIINSNYVYWKRNTKNLLNVSKVRVSSSNESYLHDFILGDTGDVLNGNKEIIKYDKGIWIPKEDDIDKSIVITLKRTQYVRLLKIYNGRINDNYIKNIILSIDDEDKEIKLNDELINTLIIDKKVKELKIKVLDKQCRNGFSEIELLEDEIENNSAEILKEIKTDDEKKDNLNNNNVVIFIDKLIILLTVFYTKVFRKIFIKNRGKK